MAFSTSISNVKKASTIEMVRLVPIVSNGVILSVRSLTRLFLLIDYVIGGAV